MSLSSLSFVIHYCHYCHHIILVSNGIIVIMIVIMIIVITVITILARCHSSVAVVIFNTDTQKFVFVQQFRPAVYVSTAASILGGWQ